MKNSIYVYAFAFVALVLGGCTGSAQVSAQGPKPSAMPGAAATNPATGECERGRPGATEKDYTDCLERMNRAMQTAGGPAPKPAAPLPQGQPQQPVGPQFPGFPPSQAVPPGVQPGAAPYGSLPSGYYPAASGPTCEVQKGVLLEVSNNTDYYLQVYAPTDAQHQYIIPLNCDAPINMEVITALHNRTGVVDQVMAVKPHAKARFVFMPLNGGWGDGILVNMKGWMFNRVSGGMVQVPSTEVGYATFRYTVPNPSGDRNWQDINPGQLNSH